MPSFPLVRPFLSPFSPRFADSGLAETRSTQPNTTSQGSPRSKRLSLPMTASSSSSSAASSLLSKRSSLPGTSTTSLSRSFSRKSTSPAHAAGRRTLSASASSTSSSSAAARDGTLLALPVAKQLQELKTRNAALSKTLASQQAETNAKLAKAAERIRQLEEEQETGKTDAEGWEAEAQRLAAELAAVPSGAAPTADLSAKVSLLERTLAQEQARRRRGKEMQAKLRCELVNRRWKEKWEVELLEREERRWETRVVEVEAEATGLRWERDCETAEKVELQVRSRSFSFSFRLAH